MSIKEGKQGRHTESAKELSDGLVPQSSFSGTVDFGYGLFDHL